MKKFERDLENVCQKTADELGLVGELEIGNPHNSFRVVLPDLSVVKVSLSSTPRNPSHYLRHVRSIIRDQIQENLKQRGIA